MGLREEIAKIDPGALRSRPDRGHDAEGPGGAGGLAIERGGTPVTQLSQGGAGTPSLGPFLRIGRRCPRHEEREQQSAIDAKKPSHSDDLARWGLNTLHAGWFTKGFARHFRRANSPSHAFDQRPARGYISCEDIGRNRAGN